MDTEPLFIAYRAGRSAFKTAPRTLVKTIHSQAREQYRTEKERECYVAGFLGDRKRTAKDTA